MAAGSHGVHLDFIRNCGERTKEWLISFMNDILLFKRANVIAIPKPGKNGSDPEHYRPIQPLIEAATPVYQLGLRKHRSCAKKLMALSTHIETGFQR
jgi:hypothetical protein